MTKSPDHHSSSTKLYSWPNPDSSIGLPDGEALFFTPENAFQLLQSSNHSSRSFALRMVILGLCAAARPLKPIEAPDEQFLC
jgi:hypothetical protein